MDTLEKLKPHPRSYRHTRQVTDTSEKLETNWTNYKHIREAIRRYIRQAMNTLEKL